MNLARSSHVCTALTSSWPMKQSRYKHCWLPSMCLLFANCTLVSRFTGGSVRLASGRTLCGSERNKIRVHYG